MTQPEISPKAAEETVASAQEEWAKAPKLRLFYCKQCHVLEELPDYPRGKDGDLHLEAMVAKHQNPGGKYHDAQLMDIPVAVWDNPQNRDAIIKQIYAELSPGLDAIAPGYYDVKNNYSADALTCYKQHNYPKDGNCSDWHAKSKEIVPDTKAERKDLGLSPVADGPKTYICGFCPVAVVRQQKAYDRMGI